MPRHRLCGLGGILILPLASIVRDPFRYFFGKAVDASLVIEPAGEGGLERPEASA